MRVGRATEDDREQKREKVKRHGNLYPKIIEVENILFAHRKARLGKAHYLDVQMVNQNEREHCTRIHDILSKKEYSDIGYKVRHIQDMGKTRTIYVLDYYPHRIIQWAMALELVPIWKPTLIIDTYSSIDGRGLHDAAKRVRKWMHDRDACRYCLKMDVRHFYPSVDHDVMKSILRRKIKCKDTLWLLDLIIDSAPGLPIGNYLSQYLGNVYLAGLDHWMKQEVGAKHYMRYCDDLVIFDPGKRKLHELRCRVDEKLAALKLEMKGNHQIFPAYERGVDFMGYRFFGSHVLVRKSIKQAFKKRVRYIKQHGHRLPPRQVINPLMSYYGWLKHCNARNLWNTYIDSDVRTVVAQAAIRANTKNPMENISWQ